MSDERRIIQNLHFQVMLSVYEQPLLDDDDLVYTAKAIKDAVREIVPWVVGEDVEVGGVWCDEHVEPEQVLAARKR